MVLKGWEVNIVSDLDRQACSLLKQAISVALYLLKSTTSPDGFHGEFFPTLRKRHMGSSTPLSVLLREISNAMVPKYKQHKRTVDLMNTDTKT